MAMEAYLLRPSSILPPACSWRVCGHDDVQPPVLAPETCCPASYPFPGYSANRSLCWRRPPFRGDIIGSGADMARHDDDAAELGGASVKRFDMPLYDIDCNS